MMGWVDLNGRPLPLTYRQATMTDAWLDFQRNLPDKTDHYLMQIVAELRMARGVKVDNWDQLRVTFPEPVPIKLPPANQPHYPGVPRPVTQADLDKAAKLGRTFGGVRVQDMKRV